MKEIYDFFDEYLSYVEEAEDSYNVASIAHFIIDALKNKRVSLFLNATEILNLCLNGVAQYIVYGIDRLDDADYKCLVNVLLHLDFIEPPIVSTYDVAYWSRLDKTISPGLITTNLRYYFPVDLIDICTQQLIDEVLSGKRSLKSMKNVMNKKVQIEVTNDH